ncbi:MAG: D-glycero-beta-D-manno-heptose 1-phosphate adenylyltransferase [Bacteroidales bacterium]|nr:D-glycero-beta-D-manno-heptose 1-phosphate adenylyltransferase [Bacteroidales bacterium]MCF8403607.1 D-glycero-beta-D-manno-heptose 1-phosphate adenylyltransferase [Bacteroidales bacterium]
MEFNQLNKQKIHQSDQLDSLLAYWKFKNYKIVFTNGCFDIIHLGHIDYLSKARSLGNLLVIGLNTDQSVRQLKGENRPVNDQLARAEILASFSFVDAVIYFDEETPYNLIKKVQPDILVKGSDYKAEDIVGYDIINAKGGKVITIDFLEGYSTSGIINKIKSF